MQTLNIENGNEYIYLGSLATHSQTILVMVTFLLKHHLTYTVLSDLLNILNLFLPNTFPASKYMFYKAIQVEDSEVPYVETTLIYCIYSSYGSILSVL